MKVIVTGASQQSFPRIAVQFEVKRSDGSFLLDAGRDDFRVTEEGRDVEVVDFQAPQNKEAIATTIVLVVDRSLSMEEEDRIGGLKTAVRSFLEKLPEGSKVALIAFGSDVDRLADFTTDRAGCSKPSMRSSPRARRGSTTQLRRRSRCSTSESGRRVVLALTDGEDTFSQDATLESVIASGQRLGLPVYTLGLGTEEEIESGDLRRLATSTRGQYYPARNADELRAIYEQIAERIRSSYSMVYQSDRKLADGTLRPVRIFYRGGKTAAGETAIFIPGMVVPAGGWSLLFLGLLCVLGGLIVLPSRMALGPVERGAIRTQADAFWCCALMAGERESGDHARECVVQTGRTSSSLGREPDPPRRSHSRARLEVPRPNHGLTTVVTPW